MQLLRALHECQENGYLLLATPDGEVPCLEPVLGYSSRFESLVWLLLSKANTRGVWFGLPPFCIHFFDWRRLSLPHWIPASMNVVWAWLGLLSQEMQPVESIGRNCIFARMLPDFDPSQAAESYQAAARATGRSQSIELGPSHFQPQASK